MGMFRHIFRAECTNVISKYAYIFFFQNIVNTVFEIKTSMFDLCLGLDNLKIIKEIIQFALDDKYGHALKYLHNATGQEFYYFGRFYIERTFYH